MLTGLYSLDLAVVSESFVFLLPLFLDFDVHLTLMLRYLIDSKKMNLVDAIKTDDDDEMDSRPVTPAPADSNVSRVGALRNAFLSLLLLIPLFILRYLPVIHGTRLAHTVVRYRPFYLELDSSFPTQLIEIEHLLVRWFFLPCLLSHFDRSLLQRSFHSKRECQCEVY